MTQKITFVLPPSSRHLLDLFPDGIAIFDDKGEPLFFNKKIKKQLKLSPQEHKKLNIASLMSRVISFDDEPFSQETFPFFQVLKNKQEVENVGLVLKNHVGKSTFSVSVGPLREKKSRAVSAVLFTFRDISSEARQTMLQKMFIKLLGHELKQPLGLIKAHTYYLSRFLKNQPTRLSTYTTKIDLQVQVLTKMLNDIVDATKFSLNTFQIQKQSTNLTTLVEELINDMRSAHPSRKFKLVQKAPADLNLMIDNIRIQQALQNLVSNAIKYSPPGSPVTISLTDLPSQVIVAVTDEGIGIKPEVMNRIFQPYFRDQKSGEVSGLGLGLAFVKNVMRRHQGNVTVTSNPNEGSTFSLVFNKLS